MSLYDLVSGQLSICQEYANAAFEQSTEYLETLADTVLEPLELLDDIEYDWPEPTVDWSYAAKPARPEDLELPEREIPEDVVIEDIAVPVFPEIPAFSGEEPAIIYPIAPSTELPEAPSDSPPMEEIEIPNLPSYTLPEVPVFGDVILPASPEIAFPIFEGTIPTADLTPPEVAFIYNEALYESDLADALKAKILSNIETGGTGLGAEVEGAIWDQAKLRMESENARIHNEALNFWAARGWTIPPGALDGRLYEVSVEQARALADINEKILIEQARLAQEMEKFIIQAGLQYEKQVMDYSNEVQNRAFQAARAAVEMALTVFQAKVVWYNAQVEAYRGMVAAYEVRIRAELGKIEIFKAQIEGAKLQIEANNAEVQLYLAQLQGVTAIIELYKSQIQAASLKAEINRLKLEVFRLQVQTYQVQVQSKVAEYDLYKAQLSGEQTKVQVYSELVKAYAVKVDGLKAEIEAKQAEIMAVASVNKNRLDSMLGKVERYKAILGADIEKIKTLATVYEVDGKIYEADIRAVDANILAQVEIYKGNLSKARNQTELLLKKAELDLQSFLQNRQLAIEAAKAGANVCAQLAASALSAVHAGANIGYSGSESAAVSESASTSESTQTVYQHIYNEA